MKIKVNKADNCLQLWGRGVLCEKGGVYGMGVISGFPSSVSVYPYLPGKMCFSGVKIETKQKGFKAKTNSVYLARPYKWASTMEALCVHLSYKNTSTEV